MTQLRTLPLGKQRYVLETALPAGAESQISACESRDTILPLGFMSMQAYCVLVIVCLALWHSSSGIIQSRNA